MSLSRIPCYVGGPYAAPTAEQVAENVRRATQLGRWAVGVGFAPVVPHVFGHAELYGCKHEADDGTSRRLALECGVAHARMVAAAGGVFLAIALDDESLSSGTQEELDAYQRACESGSGVPWILVPHPWDAWEQDHGYYLRAALESRQALADAVARRGGQA